MRVDFQRMTHTAAFAPSSTQLGPKEQDGLTAFLQVAQVTTDDPVYLEAVTSDRLGASRSGRWLAYVCLGISVLSANYSPWNPWRHPWLYDLMVSLGWPGY